MLKKLKLKNFQAHPLKTIELGQITSIVGPSDVGKSSIIRALRWLCFGQPSGEGVIRSGSDETIVSLLESGEKEFLLQRRRAGREQSWRIREREKSREFKAARGSVPQPIVEALSMREEVNLQLQLEPVFLLSRSGGEAARLLNSVVDLEAIDRAIAVSSSKIREKRSSREESLKRAEESREKSRELEWAQAARERIRELIRREAALKQKREQREAISDLVSRASRAEGERARGAQAESLAAELAERAERLSGIESLRKLVSRASRAEEEREESLKEEQKLERRAEEQRKRELEEERARAERRAEEKTRELALAEKQKREEEEREKRAQQLCWSCRGPLGSGWQEELVCESCREQRRGADA